MRHFIHHPHMPGPAAEYIRSRHTDINLSVMNTQRRSDFHRWRIFISALTLAVLSAAAGAITGSVTHPAHCGHCNSGASEAAPAVDFRDSALERAAARAIPSVVKLSTEPDRVFTVGSGIVLTAGGLILTSRHVLFGPVGSTSGDMPSATFADGRTAPLTIVGTDPATDVAVVRAEGISGCTPITLGSSAALRVGQRVVSVGSPLGLENSVTSGVVSALHRPISIAVGSTNRVTVLDTIQTDAATSFGSSGGALVDSEGALIGVNSLITLRGVGFALPIDQAIRIGNELISTGTASHAFLGARVTSDSEIRGAKVIETSPYSPAAAAGLHPGAVITHMDDRVIANAEALVAAVLSKTPGDTLMATYIDAAGGRRTSAVALASDRTWPTAGPPDSPAGTSELGYGALGSELTWSV